MQRLRELCVRLNQTQAGDEESGIQQDEKNSDGGLQLAAPHSRRTRDS
jgi:hypothetical protein